MRTVLIGSYARYLPQCPKYYKIILYNDDKLIFDSAKSAQNVETFLNKDLEFAGFGYSQISLLLTVLNLNSLFLFWS